MKLLVVDDDAHITRMLQRALSFEGYEIATAADGKEALDQFHSFHPDLIILDVMMPHLDGWDVVEAIRRASNTLILMLTAKDELEDRVFGLDLGADDYLVKPFALDELLARIRALLRRQSPEDRQVLEYAYIQINLLERQVYRHGTPLHLTAKEFELLLYLMQHPRQVLTKEQLLDAVWGYEYVGESNVVEVYIAMLRQKLEEHDNPRIIQTVRGVGYVLRSE
ncbi:response regulator transcription factor [Rubeoparvulum massiliense]|uniref:response regulator transcription factor n=1 Tax=Rubeoparvulum massiliense TaxID=1631346 RepID=UPI00065E3157|nr:response regulator transcription factor [Rubeoparvulum massiliense]